MLVNDFQPNWIHSPSKVINQFIVLADINLQSIDYNILEFIDKIEKEKVKINQSNVSLLSNFLGGSSDFWISLQKQYDENIERLESKPIDPQFKDFKNTIEELKSEQWLPSTNSDYLDQVNLKTFYGLSELNLLEKNKIISNNLGSKLKRIGQYSISDVNLATFARKVELEANKQLNSISASWNKDILISMLEEIKELTKKKKVLDILPYLQEYLNRCGVALVFIPTLSKTPICGLAKFIGNDKAVIAITPKYNRDYIFWQTLFHEIGHLILHAENMIFCDEKYENDNQSSIELEADNFMFENLLKPLKPEDLSDFIDINLLNRKKVEGWKEICKKARELNISPSLLTGILKKKGLIPYSYYKNGHYTLID